MSKRSHAPRLIIDAKGERRFCLHGFGFSSSGLDGLVDYVTQNGIADSAVDNVNG